MTRPDELFKALQGFVDESVQCLDGSLDDSSEFALKLDALERVVELLRLKHGAMENRLRMEDLFARGAEVSRGATGALRLRVGGKTALLDGHTWPAPGGRHQLGIQAPLVLFLFITYRARRPINALLVDLLEGMRPWLSPEDVESTRTGVMRAMTTTRSAARTLRLHGLLSDSPRTAYKTWELTILGLLVAALLVERGGRFLDVAPRRLRMTADGRFGGSTFLAAPLSGLIRELCEPSVVSRAFHRICAPNREVFDSFDRAVEIVVAFSKRCNAAHIGRKCEPHELRAQARELMKDLAENVPADALADDMSKELALRDLLGKPVW